MATFRCETCGARDECWRSSCPSCLAEASFVEYLYVPPPLPPKAPTLADAPRMEGRRVSTGMEGVDRVLGKDFRTGVMGLHVPSVVLFGGPPGCGKTTLLTKILAALVDADERALYASSEQPLDEVRENMERMGYERYLDRINAWYSTRYDEIIAQIHAHDPTIVIIDSLNELVDPSARDVQANLIQMMNGFKEEAFAHKRGIFVISHMNKDNEITGAKRVQHIASTVMMIEKREKYRMISCPTKHRFGSSEEVAWFMMGENGLVESDAPEKPGSGAYSVEDAPGRRELPF